MTDNHYHFWVSYFYDKNGQNGHGATEMIAKIVNDTPGERWRISTESLIDWTRQIKEQTKADNLVIISISPLFGTF